jgi:LPS O-antigen subunit length determinant protein (WzzB/FepE family)
MDSGDAVRAVREWVRPRVRLVGSAAAIGFLLSVFVVSLLAIATQYDLRFVSTQTFSLAALCFGFGLLGWSGSIFAGNGVENAQRYLDTGTNWTESDSRRAMTRICGFGIGGMIGVTVVTILLG